MLYEFAVKIKDIRKQELLEADNLRKAIEEIAKRYEQLTELKILFDTPQDREVVIKTVVSVSSYLLLHDTELETAVTIFKAFIKEAEYEIDGEISKADAFYHNNKAFYKIYT